MKKMVLIFGPHAVGKMTVGQAISRKTGLRLFHNHMSIEPFLELFDGMPEKRSELTDIVRKSVFEQFASSDQYGLIFTFTWYFDDEAHKMEVDELESQFIAKGVEVYFVELEANKKIRLQRNMSANRLEHKASKRNLDVSNKLLEEKENEHRLNSRTGEIKKDKYLKINNTNVSPDRVAEIIIERFGL